MIGQILPSHLARTLLERHLTANGAAPALHGNIAEAASIGPLSSRTPTEALHYAPAPEAPAVVPVAVAETVSVASAVTPPAEAVSVASAVTEAVAPPAPVEAAPVVAAPVVAEPAPARVTVREVEHEKPQRLRASDALDTVEKLLAGVEQRIGALARMSADRQRLHMLVCICRARAVEEAMPGVRDVEHAVARVARRLTEIGKMFWPGSVRALQLSARPADVRREMHATWASEPTNWVEATSLAERLLDEHMMKSNDAGLDEDGWADGPARQPRPTDPDALFEEVDAELKAILIPPGEVPNGRLAELTPTELEALINAARRLRWLRGAVKDDLAWGIAMGRLRRAVPGLGDRASRVRDVLDQRHKPSAPWAKLLGEREADAPESNVVESPAKLLADLPAAAESKEAMMAWLIRAFDVLNTPDLVGQLQAAHREILAAFGEDELNHADRRVRRRLRDLVKRMAEAPAPAATAAKPAAKEADDDTAEDTLAATALDALSARVRAQTTGSRALFVSNREDPELGARLEELLGITITWCDGSLRRVQAQCERISRGSYDLVLSATGFQVHGVDSALARASSAAGIPYVRVNRGRPVACVQAIAREFGLTTTTQSVGTPTHAKASC
ncbi:hypothetical protein A7982_12148 [Minicystis rosea]|nr:hypothetical protein A7982_12148 [Minicystis rosea]